MKLSILAWVLAAAASGQVPAPPAEAAAQLDARSTPRGSVFGFLEACQAGRYARAASYLDLSNWSASKREHQGPEVARQLKKVLDRKLNSSFGNLSGDPAGYLGDGLPDDRELLGRVSLDGRQVDLYLDRVTVDGRKIWMFSGPTVALVPQLYEEIGNSAIEENLPSVLVEREVFGAALWQWLALLILVLVVAAVSRLIVWIALLVVKPIVHRTSSRLDDSLIEALGPPVRLMIGILIFRVGLVWVAPPALMRVYLRRLLGMLAYFAVAWLLARLIDLGGRQFASAMARKGRSSAVSVVPLARRSLKVFAILGAVLASLELWGYNTATLLTGLGIGGVAVALAAQKTIENLFGGVALITDQPVAVGDVCKFGDRVGTVEDIGLRSTRIRTPDRTVVSVPNGQFSSMRARERRKPGPDLLQPQAAASPGHHYGPDPAAAGGYRLRPGCSPASGAGRQARALHRDRAGVARPRGGFLRPDCKLRRVSAHPGGTAARDLREDRGRGYRARRARAAEPHAR